jgi:Dolichyl-phosphate-mannose-protein mannosyltransferase
MTAAPTKSTWLWYVVGGGLLAWIAILTWMVHGVPLWLDEGISLLQMAGRIYPLEPPEAFVSGEVYAAYLDGYVGVPELSVHLLRGDVHPPAPYILGEMWTRVFGSSTEGLRFLSTTLVAGGALSIVAGHLPLGYTGRLILLLLLLISPPVLFAAANIRGYALAFFALGLAFWCLHKAVSTPQNPRAPTYLVFAMAAAGVAALSHYFTMMVLGPAFIYALTKVPTTHRTRLVGTGVGLSTGILLAVYLSHQMGARPGQFGGFRGIVPEVQATLLFLMGSFTWIQHTPWLLASFTLSAIGIYGLWAQRHNPVAMMHALAFAGFVLGVLLLFWSTDKSIARSPDRYFVFVLPSLAIGVGLCLERLRWPRVAALVAAVVVAGATFVSAWHQGVPTPPWMSDRTGGPFAKDLAINRELEGVVVLPSNVWEIGYLFEFLTEDDSVFFANRLETFHPAFEQAVQRPSFMTTPPPSWDRNLEKILKAYAVQFRACGFVQRSDYLWVRTPQTPRCTLTNPLTP